MSAEENPESQSTLTLMTLKQAINTLAMQKGKVDANELGSRMAAVILESAVRSNASDVHFDPLGTSVVVRFRVDGQLRDQFSFTGADYPIVPRFRVMANFPPRAATFFIPEDGRFERVIDGRTIQFRASSFPMIYGEKLVLRILDIGKNTLNLASLGLSPDVLPWVQALIQSPSGMFAVAGLTGSGKTTTLCSILQTINKENVNIMTLEDPVEYILPRVIHSQVNPKAGFTFADGLRSILRQDPNVIMVGEVRDLETAEIAMRAAMTGHMIFCTVHATTAVGVIHRFISMGIEPYLMTDAMIGTMAQRLARKVCPRCARSVEAPDVAALNALVSRLEPAPGEALRSLVQRPGGKYVKIQGCAECSGTGYRGRLGVFELLPINDTIRGLISKKADLMELRKVAGSIGMKTLLHDAVEKARQGLTTLEEICRIVAE